MPRSLSNAIATTEANTLGSTCQRSALEAVRVVVDNSGIAKKALAADVCDGDEPLLSKKLAGVPGRPFSLDDFEKLPRALQVKWMKRYGEVIGVKVAEIDPSEVYERLSKLSDELAAALKLSQVVMRPLKAKLPVDR